MLNIHVDYPNHIVVFDPAGKLLPGTVLDTANAAKQVARGVVTLPVDPATLWTGAVDGYAVRHFGRGVIYDASRATRSCALRVRLEALALHRVFWCARVVPKDEAKSVIANLKFAADSTQHGISAGLSNEQSNGADSSVRKIDTNGGFTVHGVSTIQSAVEGELGTVLHGIATNALVIAHAASVMRVSR